jgi:hypothetical protein
MANFVFNIAKGRVNEFYWRAENNDPTPSALILVVLSANDTGAAADMEDYDNLNLVLLDTAITEVSTANWGARKALESADLATPSPNDTADTYSVALPEVTWSAVPASNNSVGLLVCYDANTAAGTDANIIPLTHHDFAVTTDGSDVVLTASQTFFTAQD